MNPADRVVTQLPLTELWDEHGSVPGRRGRWVSRPEIKAALRDRDAELVILDIGHKPYWVRGSARFDWWKNELAAHLIETERRYLEELPDGYGYFAAEWLGAPRRIVLFEKVH